jgi:pimeloyl-ACP methyl ester carboxylesterase
MEFEINGYRMQYELFGDQRGKRLIWLSGWSGTGEDWRYVFGDVPSGFRLIGPDIRGNGASTDFRDTYFSPARTRHLCFARSPRNPSRESGWGKRRHHIAAYGHPEA